jgi:NAD(P)-dependent dehydrogenase (short-subunit alcohol dehydrogenase family)
MIAVPGKSALVTGAYGAIGKAIARQMAEKGFRTVLAGRDEPRLRQATEEIARKTGNKEVRYEVVDLSRKTGIESLASRWQGPLDILINNAARSPRKRTETPEGIEVQFATNVLGYFWMIRCFSPFMKNLPDARIVNVASYWAGGLDLEDPEFKRRRYDNDTAYRQSKQADRMLTVAFARRLKSSGITVNACHPGDVNSKLSNDLGFGGHETPDEGAATPVWVATSGETAKTTGKYFSGMQEAFCEFAADIQGTEWLFRICEGY